MEFSPVEKTWIDEAVPEVAVQTIMYHRSLEAIMSNILVSRVNDQNDDSSIE